MQFTGRNLYMVYEGLGLAVSDLQNQISTCPDVFAYADDLAEIEAEIERFEKLRQRVGRAIDKERII